MKKLSFTPLLLSFGGAFPAAAFVPVAPGTCTRSAGATSFLPSASFPACPTPTRSSATTALQMNLVDRFFRVTKANMNLVLNSLEDPEKIMSQAVEDMQKDILQVRQTYAQVMATQRRLEDRRTQHEAMAKDWYTRAQLALQRGKDDLARQALTRRQVALDEASAVQKEMNVNGAALDTLYESMHLLDQKILEAKSKREQIAARAQTAKTTIQINDMLSGVGTGTTSMDAFRRMEQKVEALEAAAEASAEMGLLFKGKDASVQPEANLEREFLALESVASIDDQLRQLKEELKQQDVKYLKQQQQPNQEFVAEEEFHVMKKKEVINIPVIHREEKGY